MIGCRADCQQWISTQLHAWFYLELYACLIKVMLWQIVRTMTLDGVEFNTLRQRQNGCHFSHDIFKWIFLNDNIWSLIKIPALVQIMAWWRTNDKPLSEPVMVSLLMHIYAALGLSELMYWYGMHNKISFWISIWIYNSVCITKIIGFSYYCNDWWMTKSSKDCFQMNHKRGLSIIFGWFPSDYNVFHQLFNLV